MGCDGIRVAVGEPYRNLSVIALVRYRLRSSDPIKIYFWDHLPYKNLFYKLHDIIKSKGLAQ